MDEQGPKLLEDQLRALLARRESRSQLRRLTTVAPDMVDFSSNSYLSLARNPDVQRAFLSLLQSHVTEAPDTTATPVLGSGGSRLLDGNSSFAETLECDIAAFHGAPAGLLFNSGFDANVGLFGCVPQPGDVIVYDQLIHASVHDGMKMSRAAKLLPFKHNTVESDFNQQQHDAEPLNTILQNLTAGKAGKEILEGKKNVFIAVEGVYSMDGDVAPLREIIECAKQRLPNGNGHIIVDEAHSTGIYGYQGRGLVCNLGLEGSIFARVHTFGKAMSCSGAIVLSSPVTRAYLINYARTLIYTTAMAFPSLASLRVTYDFLMNNGGAPLVRNLHKLTNHTHGLLQSLCEHYKPEPDILHLNEEPPKSPIIPLFTSHPRSLAQHCQQRNLMVRPIVAPTVPAGSERVRICLHAGNTTADVEALLTAVEEWLQARIYHIAQKGSADLIQRRSQLAVKVQSGDQNFDKAKL